MKLSQAILGALVFITISLTAGYGYYSFFNCLDKLVYINHKTLNAVLGTLYGVTTLSLLIIMSRGMKQ